MFIHSSETRLEAIVENQARVIAGLTSVNNTTSKKYSRGIKQFLFHQITLNSFYFIK